MVLFLSMKLKDMTAKGKAMETKISNEVENGNGTNRLVAAVNPFIANTAKDYDISYEAVEVYYNRYGSTAMFYEKLEEHLKQRSF